MKVVQEVKFIMFTASPVDINLSNSLECHSRRDLHFSFFWGEGVGGEKPMTLNSMFENCGNNIFLYIQKYVFDNSKSVAIHLRRYIFQIFLGKYISRTVIIPTKII